jgi:predicted histone-like DNA-binding protein
MLKYKIVKQCNALDKDKKEMYYPRLTNRTRMGLMDVAGQISRQSTLSKADTIAVLAALEEVIPYMLREGNIVDLGALGTFTLQSTADTGKEESEVSWRNFSELKVRFKPGNALKIKLPEVKFKKVE